MGWATYQRRKATVEPVMGGLKEQRGMRRFRLRGLAQVGIELPLACTAYNLTRRWRRLPDWGGKLSPRTVVKQPETTWP